MLKIGDVIQLVTSDENRETFKCKLVERQNEILFIDYPINVKTGRLAYFPAETELMASFVNKDQDAFCFPTKVIGRVKDAIPMMTITYPGDPNITKIQRREYVRVDTTLDAAVHPMDNEFIPLTTVTTDISAGGTAILLPKTANIHQGQVLNVWFSLPFQNKTVEYIKTCAKVIRLIPMENGQNYKAPLQFVDIDETSRQAIIRFCFQKQIQIRRMGVASE